jgi:Tfp pilus assembly protein PilF
MSDDSARRILGAIENLKDGNRAEAAELLQAELRHGSPAGERWKSVQRLAGQIGEIEIAIEAARRYSRTEPLQLDRLLSFWGELAGYDRLDEALGEVSRLPENVREHPSVLHFLGTTAGQQGAFGEAEDYYRRAIAQTPYVPQTWFALAMIKTFAAGDADLEAMERIVPHMSGAEPSLQARFLYGLAKAHHDCGNFERAWDLYAQGAALRRKDEKWEPDRLEASADALIREFTAKASKQLAPVQAPHRRALFVNGLPRSGTTLVEQILVSHSQVANGGEINLLRAALIPTGDYSFASALRYQQGYGAGDAWGALADDYFRMLAMRFRTEGLVVDKTLGQSHFMGLLLHMLPDARVVWMRRNPEDVALSCFRNYFTSQIPWSWSLEDIGRFFTIEDRLFAHWTEQYPDRILVVPYEDLVRQPGPWVGRILDHAGLPAEPQVHEFHKTKRSVKTASVSQVRQPISTDRIGLSKAYDRQLDAFRAAYRR